MMAPGFRPIGFALLGMLLAGCAASQKRHSDSAAIRPAGMALAKSQKADLAGYLLAATNSQGIYRQTDSRTGKSTEYPRRQTAAGRVEGAFSDLDPWPLTQFLDPHSANAGRGGFPWPGGGGKTNGYFVQLDPPVSEYPADVQAGDDGKIAAAMKVFDAWGVPFAKGKASRTVSYEHADSVRVDAREFPNCARFRVETDFTFGWWCTVRIREILWVDHEVGVVRRTERVSGRAMLLFTFDSTCEYELIRELRAEDQAEPLASIPEWSLLAIHLDQLHHPHITGSAIEFAMPAKEITVSVVKH